MSRERAQGWVVLGLAGLIAASASGCPGKTSPGGDTAPVSSDVPASGKLRKPSPAGDSRAPTPAASGATAADDAEFPRATLFDLYRAEILGSDAERHAALRKAGLEDEKGAAVPPRVVAYENALKRFASDHADEWSEFTDQVEQARAAKVAGGSGVEKK